MTIRQATPEDFDAIYSLVKTAFQTAKVSDGGEQDFVLKLRKGSYIPELELVAEEDGVLIGHIMLTGASIRENGGCFGTLLLAPLSVALEWRAKGIGAALIREALAKAAALGHSSAVLIGDPGYYGGDNDDFLRFGIGFAFQQRLQACESRLHGFGGAQELGQEIFAALVFRAHFGDRGDEAPAHEFKGIGPGFQLLFHEPDHAFAGSI